MTQGYYIGMISGTSRDGADAALVRFGNQQPEVKAAICTPYPDELAETLNGLVTTGTRPSETRCNELDGWLAGHFSNTVTQLLHEAGVDKQLIIGIGSHGQTVWHEPDGPQPESIQLGNPRLIAKQTGLVTVGDFRRADMDAGGQGAPLAPLLHRNLFPPSEKSATRVVLNLGGIGNISIIHGNGSVSGFDTGPANCLMDAWVGKHLAKPYDPDGRWAAAGQQIPGLLTAMLSDPYFQRPAPKSTGIEYFNLGWLTPFASGAGHNPIDVQATLAELTAVTAAQAILPFKPEDVLICGGGSHNGYLLSRLQDRLGGIPVRSTMDFGLDPDWIEAVLFAWLARERLAQRNVDTRLITGATRQVLLGDVAQPG